MVPRIVHQVSKLNPRMMRVSSRRLIFGVGDIQPKDQIPLFTMQDMRFFQHFLQYSFPHHPLGNDKIWQHEVPCLSYNVGVPNRVS